MAAQALSRRLFVAWGVPRSGTSLLARWLAAFGVDVGPPPPPHPWNPLGFYEHPAYAAAVARILGAAALPGPAPRGLPEDPPGARGELAALLRAAAAAGGPSGFKNVYAPWVMPHLLAEAARAGLEVWGLVTARPFHHGCASWMKAAGLTDPDEAARQLAPFARAAAEAADLLGRPAFVFDYEAALADPAGQAARLAAWAGLPAGPDAVAGAAAWVDRSLCHHGGPRCP